MMLIIKPPFHYLYPHIKDMQFKLIGSDFHPTNQSWVILASGTDGELYSFRKEHVKFVTKLEVALK